MVARIDAAKAAGDTLGGIVEVIALGVPVGLGSHVSWDRKLDGRLAQALMSIPAVKGVELGLGFEAARRKGSEVHDEIVPGFARASNRAGGTEGGMTTGEPVVVRVAMKPISTLMSPLKTVDLKTGAPAQAQSERSDVTAVPAMGVIAEAMLAIVLTDALLEKFGGDALSELKRNVDGYLAQVRAHIQRRDGGGGGGGSGIVKKHIVLIGLPGAGKSTVGRLVADKLQAGFVDIDTILIRKEGKPITMIFAEKGEPVFREMERKEVETALANAPAVIAPGGGWAAQPGALEDARSRAYIVYLKARAEVAAGRAEPSGTRPVLMGDDPLARMRELLSARDSYYAKADATVQTEAKPAEKVVDEVVRLAQTSAGW
jgi:chorismate synthase